MGNVRMDTFVDAAFAVHPDLKSHTSGVITLGRGAVMSKSSKQNLNTTSSTKAEQVGASDYIPNALWGAKCLAHQGYEIKWNNLHQDNQSAMKLESMEVGPVDNVHDILIFLISIYATLLIKA